MNLIVCKLYLYEAVKKGGGHRAVCSKSNLKVISTNRKRKKGYKPKCLMG